MSKVGPRNAAARARALKGYKLGGTDASAAAHAGMSADSLRRWRQDDEDFNAACEMASAEFENIQLGRINKAAKEPKHWTASAWLLERIRPERYARGKVGGDDANAGRIPAALAIQIQNLLVVNASGGQPEPAELQDDPLGRMEEIVLTAQGSVRSNVPSPSREAQKPKRLPVVEDEFLAYIDETLPGGLTGALEADDEPDDRAEDTDRI